jgi:hypothetical protein
MKIPLVENIEVRGDDARRTGYENGIGTRKKSEEGPTGIPKSESAWRSSPLLHWLTR